jgi:hypothetical protein
MLAIAAASLAACSPACPAAPASGVMFGVLLGVLQARPTGEAGARPVGATQNTAAAAAAVNAGDNTNKDAYTCLGYCVAEPCYSGKRLLGGLGCCASGRETRQLEDALHACWAVGQPQA